MTRKHWIDLSPSLMVGVGIMASTLLAVRTARFGGWVLAGPLLLALTVVSADVLRSRLRGASSGPSRAALILGAALLLSAVIVREPKLVAALLPVAGAGAWIPLSASRREA